MQKRIPSKGYWFLLVLIALCSGVELMLWGADLGLWGPARLRLIAYEYAGFWPGLLGPWQPNYAAQPYTMFLTYSILHGGIVHLVVNMFTLWQLGRLVLARVGGRGLALLYGVSILGGGLGFGLLAPNLQPMVGASGALFGLIGGLLAWTYIDRVTLSEALWPVARAVLVLVLLNVVLWWAMDGQLAWQTHLGGFLGGWIAAILIDPRARDID